MSEFLDDNKLNIGDDGVVEGAEENGGQDREHDQEPFPAADVARRGRLLLSKVIAAVVLIPLLVHGCADAGCRRAAGVEVVLCWSFCDDMG
jgi:hypothetical protein